MFFGDRMVTIRWTQQQNFKGNPALPTQHYESTRGARKRELHSSLKSPVWLVRFDDIACFIVNADHGIM
jgi:hypothetical protein